jgi:O-antigen/teichoic acid export membrane protein
MAQRVLKNTLSLLIGNLGGQAVTFATMVYLARVLGPGGFGGLSFAMATVVYFTLAADLGLPLLATREIAGQAKEIQEYAGNILPLRLLLAVLAYCLLVLGTILIPKPPQVKYLLALYGLILLPNALLLEWVFQGLERMESVGLARALKSCGFAVLVFMFVKHGGQILLVPVFYAAAALPAVALLMWLFVRWFGHLSLRCNTCLWRSLLRQALPIGVVALLIQVINYVGVVTLSFLRTDQEVGYYSVAYQVVLVLIMAIGTYHDAIFPVLSRYYKTSLRSLETLQSQTAKLMMILAIPLAVGGTLAAGPVLKLMYGEQYAKAGPALQLLVWVLAIQCANTVYARGLWACDGQASYLRIVLLQAGVSLLGNLLLIPLLGVTGAALAYVCTEAVGFPFYYREFSKIVAVPMRRNIGRPLLASAVMAVCLACGLYFLRLPVLAVVPVAVLAYFVVLLLLKGVTKEEIQVLQQTILRNKAPVGSRTPWG